MNLIIIYGPEAAGKYTVGKKLAELTGYRFFHNHLTVDVVRVLFDDDDQRRRIPLLNVLRLAVFKAAARENIDMIFTVGYIPNLGPTFIPDIIKTVAGNGGTIHFVRLTPPDATLFEHVGNESRRRLRKSTDPEHLRRKLSEYDMRAKIDYPSSIDIDTSKLSPLESARRIIKEFNLHE